jgi:uncharacterized iron-regulated membrane protein
MAKLTRIGTLAHMGSLFGLVSQLALTAMALGLLSMLFWGYRMWWQRRPTRTGRHGLTPLAPRGVLGALPQPTTFALIIVAVVVAWLLPLFGISLVAFLILDVIISRRRNARATST